MRCMDGMDLGAEIQRMMRKLEYANPELSDTARIQKAWSVSMDSTVLSHTDAVFVVPDSNGEDVIIYVDTPIWATELNMQVELMRLKLNITLNKMLEAEGKLPEQHDENALFDMQTREQVKRLRFVTSKQSYRPRRSQQTAAEQMEESDELAGVEPVPLTEQEIQQLQEIVAAIENPELRKAAFEAAKANMELQKGIVEKS